MDLHLPEEGMLLRIFIGETDTYKGKPLYEQILRKARELNLAGTTITRGIMGFGADSRVHTAKILELSEDLPIVIEIVDIEENLNKLIPFLDETVEEGLITLEKVRVIKYRHSNKGKGASR
jgi:PII-like signaling protein